MSNEIDRIVEKSWRVVLFDRGLKVDNYKSIGINPSGKHTKHNKTKPQQCLINLRFPWYGHEFFCAIRNKQNQTPPSNVFYSNWKEKKRKKKKRIIILSISIFEIFRMGSFKHMQKHSHTIRINETTHIPNANREIDAPFDCDQTNRSMSHSHTDRERERHTHALTHSLKEW